MTRLPAKITFANPPFGSVAIPAGDLGYTRNGSARLQKGSDGKIFFPTKVPGVKYVQDKPGSKVFRKVVGKVKRSTRSKSRSKSRPRRRLQSRR